WDATTEIGTGNPSYKIVPQLEFIANVLPNRDGLPWIMKCRPVAQLEAWARQAGFTQIESQLEGVGLFSVTSGRK
ncbi:MAG: class I SAM-dependent methyltransferase family protein, partial [Chloroflexota bacterium]